MKKLLLVPVLLAAACGGASRQPPAVPRIDLPQGKDLKPYDASKPGVAHPQGIASLGGQAWVTLANSDASTYSPSGPGFLASFVPSVGTVSLVNLGGADGKLCQNPGLVRAFGNHLYVACGGDLFSGAGAAVIEVDASGTATRGLAMSFSPYTLAATSTKLWVGDAATDTVRAVDLATFQLTNDQVRLGCPQGTGGSNYHYNTVADLMIMDGDLWALCGADVGGTSTLTRRDAGTGALKASINVGPVPTAIAAIGDGRVAVLASSDNTLTFVTPSGAGLTAQKALTFSSQTSALQDLRALNGFLYSTASGSNTVQKIDPNAQGGAKVVGEVNVGNGANPYDVLPLDDGQALVTNLVTGNVVKVAW